MLYINLCPWMKKAIPEAFVNGIEGIGLYPGSLSIKEMITSKGGC